MAKKNIVPLVFFATATLVFPIMASAGADFPIIQLRTWNINANFIINIINQIFNIIWPIVVTIIIVMFLRAGIAFITAQGDPAKLNIAKQSVIWGLIGIGVIVASGSIILFVNNFFTNAAAPAAPVVQCGASLPQCNGVCPAGQVCKALFGAACNCENP